MTDYNGLEKSKKELLEILNQRKKIQYELWNDEDKEMDPDFKKQAFKEILENKDDQNVEYRYYNYLYHGGDLEIAENYLKGKNQEIDENDKKKNIKEMINKVNRSIRRMTY